MKSSKSAAKIAKTPKDGHGAHWHTVGWLAAIAIVISGSTMTLSASAQSTAVTPSTLLRGINDIKTQLSRIEAKIDRMNAPAAPTASTPENTLKTNVILDRATVAPAPTEVLTDATKCRLSCEDDFTACSKTVKDETGYASCKAGYESCWTKCGQ